MPSISLISSAGWRSWNWSGLSFSLCGDERADAAHQLGDTLVKGLHGGIVFRHRGLVPLQPVFVFGYAERMFFHQLALPVFEFRRDGYGVAQLAHQGIGLAPVGFELVYPFLN